MVHHSEQELGDGCNPAAPRADPEVEFFLQTPAGVRAEDCRVLGELSSLIECLGEIRRADEPVRIALERQAVSALEVMGNSDKDFEKSNQCAFDAYCKVILRNEARDAYDQRKRKLKREQLFGEMSPEELNKLITTDRYFQFERDIVEDGLHFIVCDQGVYDALMTLPGAKRKIVLLSYFGEMNDREIGDALGTGRANVQYHRSRALAMMRKTLEQESEEY